MTSIYQKTQLINGQFQDSGGNPLSNGYLTWKLEHDSNICTLGGPTGIQVTAGVPQVCRLDMNGNVAGIFSLWTNDNLTPPGSYYTVKAYNSSGLEIWSSPQIFTLNYSPTLDLGTLQPLLP